MAQQMGHAAPEMMLGEALDRVVAEFRRMMTIILVLGVIGTFTVVGFHLIRGQMYAIAMPSRSNNDVLVLSALILFWVMVMVSLRHAQDWLRGTAAFRFAHLLSVPAVIAAAGAENQDSTASQALGDVDELREHISGAVLTEAVELVMVPMLVLLVGFFHWAFIVLAACSALIRVGMSFAMHRMLSMPLQANNRANARAMTSIGGAINAAEAVEAMGFLPALARRWAVDVEGSASGMGRTQQLLRRLQGISMALDSIMGVGPIVLMVSLHLAGVNMGAGTIGIAALFLMSHIVHPFNRFSEKIEEVVGMRAALDRLRALADQQRLQARRHDVFHCPTGRLDVDRLTVMLPGMSQPLIRDLGFRLEPGMVLSLSGPVGSGKSTLLRAIMGIQAPTSGGCYLDGHSTIHWDRLNLAQHVGYLPQDVGLTNGTVADAIARLAVPDMALVLEAAHRSGAHQTIVGLPNGYATGLSELALSAGQRQRLALARAVYGRPRLVVMDEPGAWLDAEGLEQLRRLLGLLKQDGTSVIFSSHEPGLLALADHGILLGPPGTPPRAMRKNQVLPAPVPQVAS